MTRRQIWAVAGGILAAGLAFSHPAQAELEITAPDGRRILLYDNGTWRHGEGTAKGQVADKAVDRSADTAKQDGEAVLTLERRIERGSNCRFALRLVNNLPYEIRSLVPYYAAYRADGVIYDTVSSRASFAAMKPGDKLDREIDFIGIACKDIVRVKVLGGDRCDMGDLDKFAPADGRCLARVRVVASDVVPFDK